MKVIIHWNYKNPKKGNAVFHSDYVGADDALRITDDLEKSGRAFEFEFEDESGTVWSKKELKKLMEEIVDEPQDITVYFDGGFLKEEGLAGAGVVIYFTQSRKKWRIRANKILEALESNNEAEYAALYYSLQELQELGVRNMPCTFKGDSQVVLNQLSGEWPCFEENLNRWLDRVEQKIRELGIHPTYSVIGRKENQEADKLATQALGRTFISSKIEII
ncbi:ribonuclease HI [Peribacillus deserti]|uniref:Ribonuclease HI n=1 Tax=Peribacillus deserti TaxID=673318 RepID=A0ABS2QJ68_9BACI|nr:ribonuclease H family protein [Peribacillus deserti]MBM7692573.1 ribonuclease HI [Peribacillus deserti]